jgi:hypothetical protein
MMQATGEDGGSGSPSLISRRERLSSKSAIRPKKGLELTSALSAAPSEDQGCGGAEITMPSSPSVQVYWHAYANACMHPAAHKSMHMRMWVDSCMQMRVCARCRICTCGICIRWRF